MLELQSNVARCSILFVFVVLHCGSNTSHGQTQQDPKPWESPTQFSLFLAEQIERDPDNAMTLFPIAQALHNAGKKEHARSLRETALQLVPMKDNSASPIEWSMLDAIASALYREGKKEQAMATWKKAIESASKFPRLDVSMRITVGTSMAYASNKNSAAKLLNQALEKVTRGGERTTIKALYLCRIASGLAVTGDLDQAKKIGDKISEMAPQIDDSRMRSTVLCSLASALIKAGAEEKAFAILAEAMELIQKIEDKINASGMLWYLATIYVE